MADYIYLLEHRLSVAQRAAVLALRTLAAEKGLTLFLVGGAVRDLTSGSPVRDLDFVVQGNALKLRKDLEKAGAQVTGEQDALQALYLLMQGGVRAEVGTALSATWPKPGKPVFKPATVGEDLRRRDFTANAMALSLNEGSYGLLIDPLNGVADIENRELRLVSNYGFIEEPVRMIRAARLMARLGWTLEEKTRTRYETGQQEGYISGLSDFHRGYELEELVHEEDPLRVLKRLEAEGWMKSMAPYWVSAKINSADLDKLRDAQLQLQTQGVAAEGGAAAFPLLTAKLSAQEISTLKKSFPRQGFVGEIEHLEEEAKDFSGQLTSKAAAAPSAAWKLITSARPEAVLQAAYGSRSPVVQAKLKAFSSEWPQARQKIPYSLMQEMRIQPELPGYAELVESLFFELMDGRLSTPEEMKAFLEPYSPPAPPPPVSLRRARAAKKEAKPSRSRSKKVLTEEEDLQDGGDEDRIVLSASDKADEDDTGADDDSDSEDQDSDEEDSNGMEDEDDEPGPEKTVAPTTPKSAAKAPAGKSASKPAPAEAIPVVAAPAKVTPGKVPGGKAPKPASEAVTLKPESPVAKKADKQVPPEPAATAKAGSAKAPAKGAVAVKPAEPKAKTSTAKAASKAVTGKPASPPVKQTAAKTQPGKAPVAPVKATKQATAVKKTVAPAKKAAAPVQVKAAARKTVAPSTKTAKKR